MTKFMSKSFSVPIGDSKAYRDGYERTFGRAGKRKEPAPTLEEAVALMSELESCLNDEQPSVAYEVTKRMAAFVKRYRERG